MRFLFIFEDGSMRQVPEEARPNGLLSEDLEQVRDGILTIVVVTPSGDFAELDEHGAYIAVPAAEDPNDVYEFKETPADDDDDEDEDEDE